MTRMLALAWFALAACRTTERTVEPPAPVVEREPEVEGELAPSVYDLPVSLRDANDHAIGLDISRGHPVLIAMFYASCPVACPVLIDELKRLVAEAPAGTRVLLVSFDAARDTPARLHQLADERRLDSRFTLAAAPEGDARALAAVLGFKYRKLANGEFFHGATIVALDREGRPVARTESFDQRATLLAALARP